METITVGHALSAGFHAFRSRAILLASIGLGIAALILAGQLLLPAQFALGTLLLSLLIVWPLQAGMEYIALKAVRQQSVGPRDLSVVVAHWGKLLATTGVRYALSSITAVLIAAGVRPSLLPPYVSFPLSVVGLILSLIFAFAPILVLDQEGAYASSRGNGSAAGAALTRSAQLTRGHKGTLFGIQMVAFLPALGIGTLAAIIAASSSASSRSTVLLAFSLISGLLLQPLIAASTMAVYNHLAPAKATDPEDQAESIASPSM